MIIGLILIAIIIGLLVGLKVLAIDPKEVYVRTINDAYEFLNSSLDKCQNTEFQLNYLEEPFIVNSEFNVYGDLEGFETIEDYDFAISIGLDKKEELLNAELNLSTNNNHVVNFLYSFINGRVYFQSADLYDNIIDLGVSNFNFEDLQFEEIEIPFDDMKIVLREMKDILAASIDENNFVVEEESIIVNDEIVDCDRIVYALNKENAKKTYEFIINAILENEELVTSLANLKRVDTNTLEYELKQKLEMAEYQNLIFILYRNNNKVVAATLIEGEEETFHVTYLDNQLNATLNNVLVNGDVSSINVSTNQDTYHISMTVESDIPYTVELDYKDSTFNMKYVNEEMNLNIDLTNIDISSRRIKADMDLSFTMTSYNTEETIGIRGNISLEKRTITSPDIENAINVDDISEEDKLEIEQKLNRILDRLGLEALLEENIDES